MTYVERCLYNYKANLASLEAIQDEIKSLASVHGLEYKTKSMNNNPNPVLTVLERKLALEQQILNINKMVMPVKRLQDDLIGSDLRITQMREILEMKYITHESNEQTQRKMAVSKRTFWRRVRELLHTAKKYFGDL